MTTIHPCQPYRAVLEARHRIALPDGRSAFKIYYVSIMGRSEPERYEWPRSGLSFERFERALMALGLEGIGFVVAFPHITKIFRFGPELETVLYVKGYETATLAPLDLQRAEGWMEFACLAESALAAEEHAAWGRAATVADYQNYWSAQTEWPILNHRKLRDEWDRTDKNEKK